MLPAGVLLVAPGQAHQITNANHNSILQSTSRYNAASSPNTSLQMASSYPDSSNAVSHPSGPDSQLSAGEGTYILRDSIYIATPPPHPQDSTILNPNPLATKQDPPKTGVKLSVGIINPRRTPPQLYRSSTAVSTRSTLGNYSLKEHEKESRSSHESNSDGSHSHNKPNNIFGQDNALLSPASNRDGAKPKKPKSSLVKNNSQLISRVITHDQLQKRLDQHSPEGLFIFANIDRAFEWLDLSASDAQLPQPLMKIMLQKSNVLSHDINHFTKTTNHIDVVMGCNTGDIVWFEAFSQKYNRINKNNIISTSPISEIRWLPGSENLFLASHMDGTLIVYDKERDDAAFVPEPPNGVHSLEVTPQNGVSSSPMNGDAHTPHQHSPLHINKSVTSKNQKSNPVASWHLSPHRISAFAFSPSNQPYLAVVSDDGTLRIINYMREALTDLYPSYYGGFTCVCWSPDGKYVLTGGQDDLVTLWSLHERRIVARCQGHRSWVTAMAFDPWRSCDGRNYRFGSVGEDRRLLLWDFNVGMLRRPKAKGSMQQRKGGERDLRGSVSSYHGHHGSRLSQATNRLRSNSSLLPDGQELVGDEGCLEHEVESRIVTAELPPVMNKIIDEHRMSWLGFEEDCIITTCAEGHVKVWMRPSETVNSSQVDLTTA